MTLPFIDPSATSLRDAAFWIYVRQILYNSTISQEPLDIDFSLELMPTPELLVDKHPLAWLRSETAWANQCLWLTACVANFCFSGPKTTEDASTRAAAWQELWDRNQAWQKKRPKEFDAIGRGPARDGHVFEDVWFTADWHGSYFPDLTRGEGVLIDQVISYVFHHFACILLLRYKPDTKFPTRWIHSTLSSTDVSTMFSSSKRPLPTCRYAQRADVA